MILRLCIHREYRLWAHRPSVLLWITRFTACLSESWRRTLDDANSSTFLFFVHVSVRPRLQSGCSAGRHAGCRPCGLSFPLSGTSFPYYYLHASMFAPLHVNYTGNIHPTLLVWADDDGYVVIGTVISSPTQRCLISRTWSSAPPTLGVLTTCGHLV
jgi:hypothetical protein